MPTAEEEFLETFRRFNNNWNLVLSLRQFVAATGSVAPIAIQEYHAGLLEAAANVPDFRRIFGDADKPTDTEVLSFLQTNITQMVLSNASTAIDAASLVFAQSIVDDAAWSYLKVCAAADPATPMNSYQYSEERLKIIDGRRHRIIHENAAGKALPTLADDLEYLRKTAWFLMGLVNQKYGFQLDMRKYFNLQSATTQEVIPEP